LFRSPWQGDPIVVVWLVILGLIALVRLPSYVSFGAPLSLALLFGYLTTLLGSAVWSFLLFALLPALVRRWWWPSWSGGSWRYGRQGM
jgi:hypothetical protein